MKGLLWVFGLFSLPGFANGSRYKRYRIKLTYKKTRLLRVSSFASSATLHGLVLAWVSLAPLVPTTGFSVYEHEILPYEN